MALLFNMHHHVCVSVGWLIYDLCMILIKVELVQDLHSYSSRLCGLLTINWENNAWVMHFHFLPFIKTMNKRDRSLSDSVKGDILGLLLSPFAIFPFLALQHLDQSCSRSYGGQGGSCWLAGSARLPCPIAGGAHILGCWAPTHLPSGYAECSAGSQWVMQGEAFWATGTWRQCGFTPSHFAV